MPVLRWRSRLIIPARTLDGATTQVVVGVLETTEGLKRAVLVGHGTDVALLPRLAMVELIHSTTMTLQQSLPEDQI
ncbi:hypothetical protein [Amycolatopsis sp. H20-H5]|uniref:hypothetical protein n=1 Tax=Amycolatopsis sp. H20-H5 TaxID=3046309 RepID=UPI002DBDF1E1|nr:hypothetical protein [Amycolatopsis sp. H20-H5]MEC3974914.1 hypothetical protein [Amycolatopsis sp. H20-H5]